MIIPVYGVKKRKLRINTSVSGIRDCDDGLILSFQDESLEWVIAFRDWERVYWEAVKKRNKL